MREKKWWRETQAHSTRESSREREKEKIIIIKTLASCYSIPYCSKDVKNFKNSMLDVDDTLRGWELKLGFSIFHIFDVKR